MHKPGKLLQPRSFEAFRCIGSDCEDTCCDGWGIVIDRSTYAKYEQHGDPRLTELITIDETGGDDDHYAKIKLAGTRCPFLSEGLCSIQSELGEEYLSKTCSTYPRISSVIDDVLQRTLDLSCPEAARLVLLNPDPMEFLEETCDEDLSRIANLSAFDTALPGDDKPYDHFWEIRDQVVSVLQDRSQPVSKRLITLARLCDLEETPQVVQELPPAAQLEIVLELIVARISSDFTNRRFLECYEEFMLGMEWTASSTMEDLGTRFTEAYRQYYAPFMDQHEYMLENYLVNYVHKALFPFGPQQSSHQVSYRLSERSIREHCMLLIAYFAIIKTVLIGMAAFHTTAFGAGHVVKLIQSFSRAFEHSLKYPNQVNEILASKGMTSAASLGVLVQNL